MMKPKFIYRLVPIVFFLGLLIACNSNKKFPDVGNIKVAVVVERFDDAFFAMDTNHLSEELDRVHQKYPQFLPGFITAVLGLQPNEPESLAAIQAFIRSYKLVHHLGDSVWTTQQSEIIDKTTLALQLMRHYFPSVKLDSPFVITTFTGPMDAFEAFSIGDFGEVRTINGVGVALQLHLGKNAVVYDQGLKAGLFFDYQTRRFEPTTIVVNSVKVLLDDLFPYRASGKPMVEEMIEKGKRLVVLKKLLPTVNDSLLLGYSGAQLEGCRENEALIWQFFVKNDLLYSIEPAINQLYLRDGPKTPELGDASPGYIGLYTGKRIVETYLEKYPETTLPDVMQLSSATLLQKSGYKPK